MSNAPIGCPPTIPRFSIVTVCLNAREGLLKAGESLFGQRFQSWEWVIKDAGSKDGTQNQSWADPRVRFVSRGDAGVFEAMNQAIEHCIGEYVFFLNTGDVFCDAEVLSKVSAAIETARQPEVLYTYYEYAQRGNVLKYPARLSPRYLYRRSVCHQATFVRRDCYSRFGAFDLSFRVGADDELLARLVLKERVRHVLCPVPATLTEEWNYSSRADHAGLQDRAQDYIRQRYLTPLQRLRGRLLYAATLPALRQKWHARPRTSRSYRFYLAISNFLNQHV